MTNEQTSILKIKLQTLEAELTQHVNELQDNLNSLTSVVVADPLDVATTQTLKTNLFKLKEADTATLNKVKNALTKIERCLYGDCVTCNDSIEFNRLNAQPFALFCLECQEESEKHHRTHRQPVVEYYKNDAEEAAHLSVENEE